MGKKINPKPCLFYPRKNFGFRKEIISNDILNNLEKDEHNEEEEEKSEDGNDDFGNLLGKGCGSYQMRYLSLNNIQVEDLKVEKRERSNSIIKNNCKKWEISLKFSLYLMHFSYKIEFSLKKSFGSLFLIFLLFI